MDLEGRRAAGGVGLYAVWGLVGGVVCSSDRMAATPLPVLGWLHLGGSGGALAVVAGVGRASRRFVAGLGGSGGALLVVAAGRL